MLFVYNTIYLQYFTALENKFRKDTSVNVNRVTMKALKEHLSEKVTVVGWVNEAIHEKIYREQVKENPVTERNIGKDYG